MVTVRVSSLSFTPFSTVVSCGHFSTAALPGSSGNLATTGTVVAHADNISAIAIDTYFI
jgi:hypothetical protein